MYDRVGECGFHEQDGVNFRSERARGFAFANPIRYGRAVRSVSPKRAETFEDGEQGR